MRIKNRAINKIVYNDNRLATFLTPPMKYGHLIVEHNEQIGGNLDISGDLMSILRINYLSAE